MKARKILIGTVGIDAGMLYLGDPCYIVDKPLGQKPWGEFLDDMYATSNDGEDARWWTVNSPFPNPAAGSFPAGHVVTTGWGDGEYPVEITLAKDGRVASVTVTFLPDEDR